MAHRTPASAAPAAPSPSATPSATKPTVAAPAAAALPRPTAGAGKQVPGRRGPLAVNLPQARVGDGSAPGEAPDLRLPHERDQSAVDTTAAAPDPVVAQAARDLAAGLVDTDLRNPGGLDGPRRQQLLRQQK